MLVNVLNEFKFISVGETERERCKWRYNMRKPNCNFLLESGSYLIGYVLLWSRCISFRIPIKHIIVSPSGIITLLGSCIQNSSLALNTRNTLIVICVIKKL